MRMREIETTRGDRQSYAPCPPLTDCPIHTNTLKIGGLVLVVSPPPLECFLVVRVATQLLVRVDP